MASSGTYYLNAGTLAAATAVYTDAALTTKAPDQWYSNGQISRQQVSGVLGAAQACACNIAQNYLLRDLDVRNQYGTSLTINQARFNVNGISGVTDIITAGSTTIANNATVGLLDGDLRLTSNLLTIGDFVNLEFDISGNQVGVGFDWDLNLNSFPISGNILQSNVSSFYNSGANQTQFIVPFEIIGTVPNNFDGYVSGRLTISSL